MSATKNINTQKHIRSKTAKVNKMPLGSSNPDHESSIKSARKVLQKIILEPSKACKNSLKKRSYRNKVMDDQQTSPDFVSEKERGQLRGGSRTRDELKKSARIDYNLGVVYLATGNGLLAQKYFEKALGARLMLRGADHKDVLNIHQKMGEIAMKQGDEKRAFFHFDIVARRY